MSRKARIATPDYTTCCVYCEYAKQQPGDDMIFLCMRKRKRRERAGGFGCKRFRYDLLKYRPTPKRKKTVSDEDIVHI